MSDALTPAEVAARWSVSVWFVYREIKARRLPAAKLGGVYRVKESDAEWYFEARKLGPVTGGRRRPVEEAVPEYV